jgi:hypothetical protein
MMATRVSRRRVRVDKRSDGTPGKTPPAPSSIRHPTGAVTLGEMRSLGRRSLDFAGAAFTRRSMLTNGPTS